MEISNQLIGTVVTGLLMGGLGAGSIGFVKNSQLAQANVEVEEKKDLKFASFEELCRDQLEACEIRYAKAQEQLISCYTGK